MKTMQSGLIRWRTILRSAGFALLLTGIAPLFSGPAWAIQSHPAPEGLYAHQLAHFLFIVAMALLSYWLQVNHFTVQRGWRLIQVSCLLFLVWNGVAILGHWSEEMLPAGVLLGNSDWGQRILFQGNPAAYLYFVLKMDHLVCVPAMACLLLGIRSLYREALEERGPSHG
ncbi:MAG TPA: hypothetical protein PLM79_11530 [Syntrophobacteraceae bacterium]|nr:hypothetical protein [Syntrophobacteraceae bacterium]